MARSWGVLAAVVLLLTGGSGAAQQGAAPAPVARLHHVHYAVADPAAAMADAVRVTEGVRTIVQGFGAGVRAGREFLLFDRLAPDNPPAAVAPASLAFPVAAKGLALGGFVVQPAAASHSRALTALPELPAEHLGFAVEDLDAASSRLQAAGARLVTRRDDAAVFEIEGTRIEILRETDREERFWCPMHPDVRSPDAGKCPLCAMDLVVIPPPKIGEYGLEVRPERDPRDGTIRALRFTVHEPGSTTRVTDLLVVHERTLHLFVISRDLEFFDHVHPARLPDGTYELRQPLPAGEYMLIADFLPAGGTSQMVQRAVISGRGPKVVEPRPAVGLARTATRDGLTVTLESEPARAGREVLLTFSFTDAETGRPVTDLDPYLGAPAHMLIVRTDLSDAIHAHPEEVATAGPTVSFHPLLPAEGAYKLWIQVQRRGRVITVPFVLRTEM